MYDRRAESFRDRRDVTARYDVSPGARVLVTAWPIVAYRAHIRKSASKRRRVIYIDLFAAAAHKIARCAMHKPGIIFIPRLHATHIPEDGYIISRTFLPLLPSSCMSGRILLRRSPQMMMDPPMPRVAVARHG